MRFSNFIYKTVLMVLVIFFASCSEDDDGVASDMEVTDWIYETMEDIYLWEDELPIAPDFTLSPEDFFASLKYEGDRFSILYPDYDELIGLLNGVSLQAGYEYQLMDESDGVVALITLVKPNSPAESAGLTRGDKITHINGTVLTQDNYQELLSQISSPHTLSFSRGESTIETYENISLSTLAYEENPNYLDTVYESSQGKIGYYVYNFFAPGDNDDYDQEMDDIFSRFITEDIDHLIIDMRYNSGGYISSAINMASLVVAGASSLDIFYQNEWNNRYQQIISREPDGDEILNQRFENKSENIGDLLSGTVYIIVGERSASATELVINGLTPFMNVVLVGAQTVGKNVGSIAIDDDENSNNAYGLLPIVLRSANALGESDYEDGFTPEANNLIDEFEYPLAALGDINETLLNHTINLITGDVVVARQGSSGFDAQRLSSSLDDKAYSNRSVFSKD